MAVPTWIVLAILEFIVLGVFAGWMVRFYANKSSPFYSLLTVFVAWYLGFFGTLFLPIDIAEAYDSMRTLRANVSETLPFNNTMTLVLPSRSALPSPFINGTGVNGTATRLPLATPSWSATASVAVQASASGSYASTWSSTSTALPLSSVAVTATATGSAAVPSGSAAAPSGSDSGTPSPTASLTPSASPAAVPSGTGTGTGTPSSMPTAVGGTSASSSTLPSTTSTRSMTRTPRPTPSRSGTPTPSRSAGASYSSSTTPTAVGRRALRDNWDGQWQRRAAGEASATPSNGTGLLPPTPSSAPNSTTIYEVKDVVVQVRNGPLEAMWQFVYWTTFIMTYAVIPIVQEYVAAGEFTKRGRLWASVRINLVFYAVCVVVAFGALAYVVVVVGQTLWDILPVLTSLANTSGLVIIVLLLGYGTAEVPRALWRLADAEGELRRLYFRAPELDSSLFDCKGALGDIVKTIAEFGSKLTAMAVDKEFADGPKAAKVKELQRCYGIVLRKVALARDLLGASFGKEATDPISAARRAAAEKRAEKEDDDIEDAKADEGFYTSMGKMFGGKTNKYAGINPARLAKLHKKVTTAISVVKKTAFRWDELVTRCIELEYTVSATTPPLPLKRKTAEGGTYYVVPKMDAVHARSGASKPGNAVPRGGVAYTARGAKAGEEEGMDQLSERAAAALLSMQLCPTIAGGFFNAVLWRFNIYARPAFFKTAWAVAEIMSILLLWSEATIWINLSGLASQNLSVFGILLALADDKGGAHAYAAVQLVSAIPLAYMCACSTFTVFRIKLFDMLDLSGGQNTDPYSLLLNASLFNRLQFSLAFNYLNVLMHSNDRQAFPNTAFLNSVGAKMSLSVVDWYLPVFMVVLYGACKLNLFDKLQKRVFGVEDKGDPTKGDRDDETLVREGAILVSRGRRTLGLGGSADGTSDEDRAKHEELSRNRIAAVMARAAARRAGQNPDDVIRLDDELSAGVGSPMGPDEVGGGGSGAQYASGGGGLSSTQGMFNMATFAAAPPGSAAAGGAAQGGGAAGGLGAKLGLADLARRAKLDKLGAAMGLGPASGGSGEGAEREVGASAPASSALTVARMTSVNERQRPRGASGASPGLTLKTESPPSLAQLLRGKRTPGIGPPKAAEGTGYGLSDAALARRPVAFEFDHSEFDRRLAAADR